jgi:hypothetical protein
MEKDVVAESGAVWAGARQWWGRHHRIRRRRPISRLGLGLSVGGGTERIFRCRRVLGGGARD